MSQELNFERCKYTSFTHVSISLLYSSISSLFYYSRLSIFVFIILLSENRKTKVQKLSASHLICLGQSLVMMSHFIWRVSMSSSLHSSLQVIFPEASWRLPGVGDHLRKLSILSRGEKMQSKLVINLSPSSGEIESIPCSV